jgi:hypothetical protein
VQSSVCNESTALLQVVHQLDCVREHDLIHSSGVTEHRALRLLLSVPCIKPTLKSG